MKNRGKVKNNKLFVVKTSEQEIDSEQLTSEYKKLCDREQELLNRQAEITERKQEIRTSLEEAIEDVKGNKFKSKITNQLNSAEPREGKPREQVPFNRNS